MQPPMMAPSWLGLPAGAAGADVLAELAAGGGSGALVLLPAGVAVAVVVLLLLVLVLVVLLWAMVVVRGSPLGPSLSGQMPLLWQGFPIQQPWNCVGVVVQVQYCFPVGQLRSLESCGLRRWM